VAAAGCSGRAGGIGLRETAIAALDRVPPPLQEPLLSGVNDLEAQLAACGIAPRTTTVTGVAGSPSVEPVPHEPGAAAQARALAAWVRRYSR
jgi:hypothetical protein